MMRLGAILERIAGVPASQDGKRSDHGVDRIVIVGSPNVGKSALFNRLTGRYVTVSNYPGTTVEISAGRCRALGDNVEIIDTPGMYSLMPVTDEEQVARDILFAHKPRAVLHVIDAKNIERMLGLTLQLCEAQLPLVLVLNMADEAESLGIHIDCEGLSAVLGVPVVKTVATRGQGMPHLLETLRHLKPRPGPSLLAYEPAIEHTLVQVAAQLDGHETISARTRAALLLQEDAPQRRAVLANQGAEALERIDQAVHQLAGCLPHSPQYHLSLSVKKNVDALLATAVRFPPALHLDLREKLSQFCMRPLTGVPILLVVLYFGLYQFVGVFGAGTCVDFVESVLFEEHINPWFQHVVQAGADFLASVPRLRSIHWPTVQDLFTGEYGILTLGLRYAIAIILPVVGTFFLAFSLLEDSGYLPRLAMLIDRVFKKIGLNGRAVIPMVLGFGCDTMATMVTRTLETRRERLIATLLLALAIPCSAQMGLILALLAHKPLALIVWAGCVTAVFLAVGFLAGRFLPGERASFYMELPPLRLPRLGNVLVKTYTRLVWYLKEVLPLFIIASVLIWLGRLTGVFQAAVDALTPVVGWLGLPEETAVTFLFGFFRRDYGAAGLYDLQQQGLLSGNQLAVSAVTLTLFLPCVAQFLIMKKERGWKVTLLVSVFICAVAFLSGLALHSVLAGLGVRL